jgi:hypothetical protein
MGIHVISLDHDSAELMTIVTSRRVVAESPDTAIDRSEDGGFKNLIHLGTNVPSRRQSFSISSFGDFAAHLRVIASSKVRCESSRYHKWEHKDDMWAVVSDVSETASVAIQFRDSCNVQNYRSEPGYEAKND